MVLSNIPHMQRQKLVILERVRHDVGRFTNPVFSAFLIAAAVYLPCYAKLMLFSTSGGSRSAERAPCAFRGRPCSNVTCRRACCHVRGLFRPPYCQSIAGFPKYRICMMQPEVDFVKVALKYTSDFKGNRRCLQTFPT